MAERARSGASRKKRSAKRKSNGAGPGHNSNVVGFPGGDIPDEVRQRHLDAITRAELAVERARAPLKAAQNRLQAIKQTARDDGVHVEALYDARTLSKRDRIDVLQRYGETGKFLRLMDSPLVTQLELFRTGEWPEPVSVNLQGYRAGKSGAVFDSPHPPGSEQYIHYKAGYDTAQQELQEQLRRESQ